MSKEIQQAKKINGIPAFLQSRATQALRFPLSELPKELRPAKRASNALRAIIEAECMTRHGRISATKAAYISTACRYEQLLKATEHLLKQYWDELSPLDRASMLDRVGKFSQQRDQAIAKLDLDTDPHKLGNALDIMFEPKEEPADGS